MCRQERGRVKSETMLDEPGVRAISHGCLRSAAVRAGLLLTVVRVSRKFGHGGILPNAAVKMARCVNREPVMWADVSGPHLVDSSNREASLL